MKLKLIACEVLFREFCRAASEVEPVVETVFKSFGLHETPDQLRVALQEEIDRTDSSFDAIILGYGLCSRGVSGLTAREVPLVITRAHDCITLLLGSKERYQEVFFSQPGTYYYSSGWVERSEGMISQSHLPWVKELQMEKRYQEYVEKYGEDNAKYLIEMESGWMSSYSRAVFINMGLGNTEQYREFTQRCAREKDWEFQELEGDLRLVRELLSGNWNTEDFAVVPPGSTIVETNTSSILEARDNKSHEV